MATFETVSAPPPSKRQIMLATESTKTLTTKEEIHDEDTSDSRVKGASVEHTTSSRVLLWQPWKDRWLPKEVAATNIAENFEMGWRTECGNCGTTHGIEQNRRKGSDINACPSVPRLAVAYCPTCRAPFHDPGMEEKPEGERDPEAIELYATSSTPQTRIKAMMDLHILTYHPNDAVGYGIIDNRPAARPVI